LYLQLEAQEGSNPNFLNTEEFIIFLAHFGLTFYLEEKKIEMYRRDFSVRTN
jgi:hypothetical protein